MVSNGFYWLVVFNCLTTRNDLAALPFLRPDERREEEKGTVGCEDVYHRQTLQNKICQYCLTRGYSRA